MACLLYTSMQEYVIELSKYFIAFFIVLYTASCFYTFRYPVGEKHRGVFILQDLLMFLVQVLCFLNLSLVSGDFQYLFFFAFILIFLFATITMVSLIYENINRLLLNNMCMLLGIGLCIVSRLSFGKAIRQYVIVLVSLIFSQMCIRDRYDKHIVADFYRLLFAGQERRGLSIHVCICEWLFGRYHSR